MIRTNYLITGASSDLGRALIQHLQARRESRIMLVSRGKIATPLVASHRVLDGLDLTREVDLLHLRAAASEFFAGPFAVIHSVGDFWKHKPLARTGFDEIVRMIHSHYLTLSGTAWALLPLMVQRGGGALTAFSCNSVGYSYPDMAPFTAAKAAVESFVRCIANEYSEYGVTANAIALPTVRTAKVVESKPGDHEHYLTPAEVAHFIVEHVLVSPPALNGNVLKVFRHSTTFFHQSYFQRNPRELPIVTTPEGVDAGE